MNRFRLQAQAERERRRRLLEGMSHSISAQDINPARYNRWILIQSARMAAEYGFFVDAPTGSDFLRSEVERFEAWNLKQAAVMGIDKLSDEALIAHYQALRQKLVACYTDNENSSSETAGNMDGTTQP